MCNFWVLNKTVLFKIKRMKSLRLSTKQVIGFGVILVIMASVNIFSVYKLANLKDDVDVVTTKWLPSVIVVSEINHKAAEYRILEMSHALDSESKKMKEYEEEMTNLRNSIKTQQDRYERLIATKQEEKIYNTFLRKWERYLDIHRDAIDLSGKGEKQKALDILNGESQKLFIEFSNDLGTLVKINKDSSQESAEMADKTYQDTKYITIVIFAITSILSAIITFFLINAVTKPLKKLSKAAQSVAKGNIDIKLDIQTDDEIGKLAQSFNEMTHSLKTAKLENEHEDWVKTGQNQLNERIRIDHEIHTLAKNVITFLAKYLGAQVGAMYVISDDHNELQMVGSYAFTVRKNLTNTIKIGEGLAGQAALENEMIVLENVPEDYMRVSSALGDSIPRNVVVSPFRFEGELIGVIELGSFNPFKKRELDFLNDISEHIGVGFHSAQSGDKIKYLLQQTQKQAEELQKQQKALQESNEDLEEQAEALRKSETMLKAQQEELQAINEELEEKTQYLQQQQAEILAKNKALEVIRKDLEQKAKELEITSRYKSEFLANMSHELRTPLNSLLILARNLSDNKKGNLNEDQVQSAQIIYRSGNDLLELINDILDLSKIEAGKMTLHFETVRTNNLGENVNTMFSHMTQDKGLYLKVEVDEKLPEFVYTDKQRLEQVIKNMMSNGIKFTSQGGITVKFFKPDPNTDLTRSGLNVEKALGIAVSDTGIGIPKEKQLLIFEAFQQADGSTSRQFGGTGLGLSISREICKILGGEIHISSEEGKGSTFTIFVPTNSDEIKAQGATYSQPKTYETQPKPTSHSTPKAERPKAAENPVPTALKDDRNNLQKGDQVILVIEDDVNFAQILIGQCHEKDFKCIVAHDGQTGLQLAEKYMPTGIILDIKMPIMNGWEVLEELKHNHNLRHIPIHMMSVDEVKHDALKKGAIGFLTKPVRNEQLDEAFNKFGTMFSKTIKELLVVEDDQNLRNAIKTLIADDDVRITDASTGKQALELLATQNFDCIVLDLGLPDMTGYELLTKIEQMEKIEPPPIIVYTGRDLSKEEEEKLQHYADSIIIKGAKSEEKLLDETALFLHRVVSNMPQAKQKMITNLYEKDNMFEGKRILLVDDDMRNVFALSRILQEKNMEILKAENGQKALQVLEKEKNIDLVLMDIMMPIMDGYEAMKQIRLQDKFKKLPVIALTAKAMKEDREKCIEAGASDYMPKPVDTDRLLSMMRVWLYK